VERGAQAFGLDSLHRPRHGAAPGGVDTLSRVTMIEVTKGVRLGPAGVQKRNGSRRAARSQDGPPVLAARSRFTTLGLQGAKSYPGEPEGWYHSQGRSMIDISVQGQLRPARQDQSGYGLRRRRGSDTTRSHCGLALDHGHLYRGTRARL